MKSKTNPHIQAVPARNQGSRPQNHSHSACGCLQESWILEFLGFLIAAGALAAIIVLLRKYDGQLNPQFPVTLNVMVSLLGGVANTATLTGAKNSIAQLKWIWFARRTRPLNEFRPLQDAGGGPFGATQLLIKTGPFHFVALGAVAVIISVLSDPFIQNLIHYDNRNIRDVSQASKLARSLEYTTRGPRYLFGRNYTDPLFALSMQTALVTAPNTDANLPTYFCSTGNCTWDPVATLGFCPLCADISSIIVVNCSKLETNGYYCAASLPEAGATLNWESDTGGVLMDIRSVNASSAKIYDNSTGPVFQSLRMVNPPFEFSSAPTSAANYTATECSINLCVLSIQPSVSLGNYSETIIDTWMEPNSFIFGNMTLSPPWGPERGVTGNQSFSINSNVSLDWQQQSPLPFPDNLIVGNVSTSDANNGVSIGTPAQRTLVDSIYYDKSTPADCGSPNNDNFACSTWSMAGAMTKTMRNAGVQANGANSTDLALGQTQVSATFVRVEWYWMALPFTVWLLGVLTWFATLVQTWRWHIPSWRGNPLPFLFLYPEDAAERREIDDMYNDSNAAYEELAQDLRVRLRDNGFGKLRLVREQ